MQAMFYLKILAHWFGVLTLLRVAVAFSGYRYVFAALLLSAIVWFLWTISTCVNRWTRKSVEHQLSAQPPSRVWFQRPEETTTDDR